MDKAVEFAMEIIRKERAVCKTNSEKLKRDYMKSIRSSKSDLRFYCESMKISYNDVMCAARAMVT